MNKAPYYFSLVTAALNRFSEIMQPNNALKDGCLTARVVGEFSAGKTRLLSELLKDDIPPALFPVSSIERQTKLQLEITYGETAELSLIEREEDYDEAIELQKLTVFPSRDELSDNFLPETHRLRLSIPEQRLILPNGDGWGDEKIPMRLFLIDTPGWNSGEDDIAEREASQVMTGYHNLGLVYVSDANRLDGNVNQQHLKDFLEVLQSADFLQQAHLLFVVTHCPSKDQERLKTRATNHVLNLWQELGYDKESLSLYVMCVDFAEFETEQRAAFREEFWRNLLAPLGEPQPIPDPWINAIHHWPKEWDIRPKLQQAWQQINHAKATLSLAMTEGQFVKGMNMSRLLGLSAEQVQEKVMNTWLKQLKIDSKEDVAAAFSYQISLEKQHPLSEWWKNYWQARMQDTLVASQRFMIAFEKSVGTINPKTEDLQQHFAEQLEVLYQQALESLDSSFTRLVETAQCLVSETALEKVIATLLTLSLLESRYNQHYNNALQGASL